MELLGLTFDVLGKIMIAFTAIMVHHRFWKEHKIDKLVFKAMKQEQIIGILGLVFIVIGYFFQISGKF